MKWFAIAAWVIWGLLALIIIATPSEPDGAPLSQVLLAVAFFTALFCALHLLCLGKIVTGLAAVVWVLWALGVISGTEELGGEDGPTLAVYLTGMGIWTLMAAGLHLIVWSIGRAFTKARKPAATPAAAPAPEVAAPRNLPPASDASAPMSGAERGEKLARVEVLKSQIRADDIERRNYRRPGYYAIGFLVFGVMALFGGLFTLIGLGMCALLLFGAVVPDQDKRELKRLMVELERDK